MRNNETGEFELVVGNRQLLSGFFIVVLLFAVAFAMGYVVGENSRSAKAQTDLAGAGTPGGTPSEPRPQPASASPANPPAQTPAQPAESSRAPVDRTPQPTTQPSPDVPPPTREVPPPSREVPPPKREPPPPKREVPATHETKAPPVPTASNVPPAEAPPGQYWQVLATANNDSAQTMLHSLQDKGLPSTLSPGPNNVTRVLVGPFRDTASLTRAKTELEAAGLHPIRR
jgi:cell division protein FtsN